MDANEVLRDLTAYHGQKFSEQQLNDYVWFFDGHSENATAIIKDWKHQNAPSSRFPSVAQLVHIADTIRLAKWQTQKESEPTFREAAERASSRSEYGKLVMKEIIEHYEHPGRGEPWIQQWNDWILSMQMRFPGKGWGKDEPNGRTKGNR
jgi:hypothetical protein